MDRSNKNFYIANELFFRLVGRTFRGSKTEIKALRAKAIINRLIYFQRPTVRRFDEPTVRRFVEPEIINYIIISSVAGNLAPGGCSKMDRSNKNFSMTKELFRASAGRTLFPGSES